MRIIYKPTQSEFVDECKIFLLSNPILDDNLISQEEIADFLSQHCASFGFCEGDDTNLDFHNLSIDLQIGVINSLCPGNSAECLQSIDLSYESSGGLFGFEITENNREEIETSVENLCYLMYPMLNPTSYPSMPPSLLKSTTPSISPSVAPTISLKQRFEATPSGNPTFNPSSHPSTSPSLFKSMSPSISPIEDYIVSQINESNSPRTDITLAVSLTVLGVILFACTIYSTRMCMSKRKYKGKKLGFIKLDDELSLKSRIPKIMLENYDSEALTVDLEGGSDSIDSGSVRS